QCQVFFLRERRLRERLFPFFGTFLPLRRASERPIAIACLRLFTFLPLRPLRSLPDLRFFIALRTSLPADFEYFRAIENVLSAVPPRTANVPREVSFRLESGDRIVAPHQLTTQHEIDAEACGKERTDCFAIDM